MKVDYEEVALALDKAWRQTSTAEEYLMEIFQIWSRYGLLEGTWTCELAEAV